MVLSPDPSLTKLLDARSLQNSLLVDGAREEDFHDFWTFEEPWEGPLDTGVWDISRVSAGGAYVIPGPAQAGPGAQFDTGSTINNVYQMFDRFETLRGREGFCAEALYLMSSNIADQFVEWMVGAFTFEETSEFVFNPDGVFGVPASQNWQIVSYVGGVLQPTFTTGVVVQPSTRYRLRIEEALGIVRYSINGAVVHVRSTANGDLIPDPDAGRPAEVIIQTNVGANRSLFSDYVRLKRPRVAI
jgi:hypothetical protein